MKSPLSDIKIPTDVSVPQMLLDRVAAHGDKVAFINSDTEAEYTFRDVLTRVKSLASALAKRGFTKGDVVCLYSQNNIDFPIVVLAVMSLGGIVSPANYHYIAREIEIQLRDSNASFLICGQEVIHAALTAAQTVSTLKEVVVIGHEPGCKSSLQLSELYEDDGSQFALADIDPLNDVVALPYSSGTTGPSKGVVWTHYNTVAGILQLSHPAVTWNSGSETFISFCPLTHVYGLTHLLLALYHGDRMVIMPTFEAQRYMECIEKYKGTTLNLVPPVAVIMATDSMADKYDFSSVRDMVCAVAPLGQQLTEMLMTRMNINKFRQGYGLTEANGGAIVAPHDGWKHGSIGLPLPNTEVKIMDIQTGSELGPNENGELWIKGPNIMREYLNNPTATKETIDSEGFLHTGDIGHYDEDGHFYIVDRLKELIKHRGFQVSPSELEAILLQHPDIAQAGVIGVPDLVTGELPKAIVVLKPGVKVSPYNIKRFVAERVASYKRLSGGVVFVDELPMTPSGKILRRQLREKYTSTNFSTRIS